VAHAWTNFAVITGSASGALAGLLFVAVSLIRERIASHIGLRIQAGQTLVLFMLPLLLSVLLVLPESSMRRLGIELVVLALVAATVLVMVGHEQKPAGRGSKRVRAGVGAGRRDRGAERTEPPAEDGAEDRLARLVDRASPNLAVVGFILVAGCLELAGVDGLYWVALSSVLALVGGVVNAWLFLTR
jgi:hypothetical protein